MLAGAAAAGMHEHHLQRGHKGWAPPRPNTPEEFARFVRAEIDKLSKVVKVASIRVE